MHRHAHQSCTASLAARERYFSTVTAPGAPHAEAAARADLHTAFKEAWLRCSPDFQTKYSYGRTPKGRANLKLCGSQVAERFK